MACMHACDLDLGACGSAFKGVFGIAKFGRGAISSDANGFDFECNELGVDIVLGLSAASAVGT